MTGAVPSPEVMISLIAAAFIVFAVVYHKALDYPWVVVWAVLFVALLATGGFDASNWGLKEVASAPHDPTLRCGGRRSWLRLPCELEAPPVGVLLGLLVIAATAFGMAFQFDAKRPLQRGLAALGIALALPWVLALAIPRLHITWFYTLWAPQLELIVRTDFIWSWYLANAFVLAGVAALIAAGPAVQRWIGDAVAGTRADLRDLDLRGGRPTGGEWGQGLTAVIAALKEVAQHAARGLRNIRHKGWAASFGLAAAALALHLLPASGASPMLVLVFPAAFFAGMTVWVLIEACLVEPGAWD